MRRAALLALALFASLLLSAGTAEAEPVPGGGVTQDADVKGGFASCTTNKLLSSIHCDVTDNAADKASIYVALESMGETRRYQNSRGSGTSKPFDDGSLLQGGSGTALRWKVCRDETFESDECSEWKKHAVGPAGAPIELVCELATARQVPTCYLPTTGLETETPSSNCLATIALTAAGIADSKGKVSKKVASKVLARAVPGGGWALTVVGVGQGVAQCI